MGLWVATCEMVMDILRGCEVEDGLRNNFKKTDDCKSSSFGDLNG